MARLTAKRRGAARPLRIALAGLALLLGGGVLFAAASYVLRSGHWPYLEEPERFQEVVRAFLAE